MGQKGKSSPRALAIHIHMLRQFDRIDSNIIKICQAWSVITMIEWFQISDLDESVKQSLKIATK